MNTNGGSVTGSSSLHTNTNKNKTTTNDPECRLDYVCEAHGISKTALHQVTEIDFVLDEVCRMDFLPYFTNLKSLIMINQGITEIEGLEKMTQIEQIWLNENLIDNIKGLDKLRTLKELYLGNNRIRRIRGMDGLINLEKLWLDENRIEQVEGLSNLVKLKELNLAGNKIECIGMGLDGLIQLEELSISHNKIGNFKEVLNLNRLPNLRVCSFQDPHYGDNPICNLCNYQTFVLYHLPNLSRLDTLSISDDAKAFADATFMKKRMYYNMRIKTIQRNASNIVKLLKICKKIKNFKIDIQFTKMSKKMNEIMREIEERQYVSRANRDQFENVVTFGLTNAKKNPLESIETEKLIGDLESKKALIQGRIHDKNEDVKDLEIISEGLSKKVYEMSEQNIHRLMTELDTGGNIRFEEGKPTDKWFSSCVDLVRSRFNPEQMKTFGINGINVTRVTRIHNRFLRNRFEEKLEQLVDLSDNSYKRSLEYLFYGVDPLMQSEMHRAMEEGFRTPAEYQETGMPHCVSLVNSVASAEIARINSFFQAEDGNAHIRTAAKAQKLTEFRMSSELTLSKGLVQIPSGQLLVCKVFLSKCVPDSNSPFFNPSHSPSEIWRYAPVDTKHFQGVQSVYRTKENDQKQRMWFVLDNALVLPEYLVEFEYLNNLKPPPTPNNNADGTVNELNIDECNRLLGSINNCQKILENTYVRHGQKDTASRQNIHLSSSDLERSDMGCLKKTLVSYMKSCHIEELLLNNFQFSEEDPQSSAQTAIENSMPPEIPIRSKIEVITEKVLQNVSCELDLSNVAYLNLFNNRIKKIQALDQLTSLNTLILSFNEIEAIEGLQNCKLLKRLDLNHNFIRKIEGLENKSNLQQLNLTNNWISEISQIEHLRTNCSNLKEVSLKCNPLAATTKYRATVFARLITLTKLDGIALTEKDKDRQKSDFVSLSMEIIQESLKQSNKNVSDLIKMTNNNLNKDNNNLNTLTISQQSSNGSQGKSNGGAGFEWQKLIETLILNHKQISKIENLDHFVNLRKLQLSDNCIEKIEGLSRCKLLEELSLDKNKIVAIEGISHLKYLKKLDLGRNKIKKIEGLNTLECLTQLSLEDNEIAMLDNLDNLQSLMELYLGNNLINDIREVTKLKSLSRLIILDISGNNLARDSSYRIYCIFHLRKLKVLDGISIEQQEHTDAKETFAGRLTEEILDQRLNGKSIADIKELDLSSSRLRDFDNMFDESLYPNLRDLNLSHNSLVSLRGFGYMPKLRILKIKANRLETLFCKPNDDGYPKGLFGLPGLEVLDVSFNNLHDLYGLQYAPMKDLKILNASNNDIVKVDFLDKLKQLRELDLSKNRIRQIDPNSFQPFHIITCLRLEDNGLRNLVHIEKLERLQSVFVGGNRVVEFWEVDRLAELPHLMEINLANNPMARKPNYRNAIIKRLPSIVVFDGKEITPDERMRIEQTGGVQDQKAPPMIHFAQYPNVKVPVKLNAVNFDGVFNNVKAFTEQQQTTTTNAQGKGGLTINNMGGIIGQGVSSGGLQFGTNNNDMGNLIQVSSIQLGAGGGGLDSNNFNQGIGGQQLNSDKIINSGNRRPSTKTQMQMQSQQLQQQQQQNGLSIGGIPATSNAAKGLLGAQKNQFGQGSVKPPVNQQRFTRKY